MFSYSEREKKQQQQQRCRKQNRKYISYGLNLLIMK